MKTEQTKPVTGKITIEKGISIHKKYHGIGKWQEVFEKMNIGDSFETSRKEMAAARGSLYKKYPHAFTIRKTGENTCRFWRTK